MKLRSKRSYGQTKLDHVLSHVSYSIKDACVLIGIIAGTYVAIHWITDFLANWIYCHMM